MHLDRAASWGYGQLGQGSWRTGGLQSLCNPIGTSAPLGAATSMPGQDPLALAGTRMFISSVDNWQINQAQRGRAELAPGLVWLGGEHDTHLREKNHRNFGRIREIYESERSGKDIVWSKIF
jgi:hypothetical protein